MLRDLLCTALLSVLLCASSSAGTEGFVPLRETREPELQRALEGVVSQLGLERLVRQRQLGIALVGISDPSCPRFAAVNGDVMMYAASLPKIAILLAAFRKIDAGNLELDDELAERMTAMIRRSSNRAATEVMNRVGRDYVNTVLQSPELALYDRRYNGGLWVGKEYGPRPAWRRDPLHHISHGASATQVARFYYLLETGRLLGPESTARMKEMLSQPGIQHKFVAGIRSRHPGARFLRKSGTWRNHHADSAVIEHGGKRYVAVAMAQSDDGEKILRRLIVELDRIIFEIPAHCPEASEPASDAPSRSDDGSASPGSDG